MNRPLASVAAAPGPSLAVQRVTAACGVEAWLVEEHSLPLLALEFAFDGGANRDPANAAGSANLISGLLDEGAGDLDAEAFQGASPITRSISPSTPAVTISTASSRPCRSIARSPSNCSASLSTRRASTPTPWRGSRRR